MATLAEVVTKFMIHTRWSFSQQLHGDRKGPRSFVVRNTCILFLVDLEERCFDKVIDVRLKAKLNRRRIFKSLLATLVEKERLVTTVTKGKGVARLAEHVGVFDLLWVHFIFLYFGIFKKRKVWSFCFSFFLYSTSVIYFLHQ